MRIHEVHLDKQIGGSEEQQSVRELFAPDIVRITAKYSLTPNDVWITIIFGVSASLIASVLWDAIKQVAINARIFIRRHKQEDHRLCAAVIYQTTNIKYEIRFVVENDLSECYKTLMISSLSPDSIHPDTSRVVVDLLSMEVRTLDAEGLLIEETEIQELS